MESYPDPTSPPRYPPVQSGPSGYSPPVQSGPSGYYAPPTAPGYYPVPQPGYYPVPFGAPPPSDGLAVASLVCALLGFFGVPGLFIAAIVCGHLARGRARRQGRPGSGIALAGLIIGYITAVLYALLLAVIIWALLVIGDSGAI
jgi:hypothetical protein